MQNATTSRNFTDTTRLMLKFGLSWSTGRRLIRNQQARSITDTRCNSSVGSVNDLMRVSYPHMLDEVRRETLSAKTSACATVGDCNDHEIHGEGTEIHAREQANSSRYQDGQHSLESVWVRHCLTRYVRCFDYWHTHTRARAAR
jgi:hypothetical protein